MSKISIAGLNKAAVLAALYNVAKPLGLGFVHYDPTPMTVEQAQGILDQGVIYFDYLKGRVMKVSLKDDEFDPRGFDRDNGLGAAQAAIDAMKASGDVNPDSIAAAHKVNTIEAAHEVRSRLGEKSRIEVRDGVAIMTLGMDDMAEHVAPKIDKVLGK